MRKTIYLLAATAIVWGVAAPTAWGQTATSKDHLTAARQLYDAGQWAQARYEFDKAAASERDAAAGGEGATVGTAVRVEAETFAAFCAARLEQHDAGERLERLLEIYPASPYTTQVKFRAGVFYYDRGENEKALELLAGVETRGLRPSECDELHFKRGHALFVEGMEEDARADLESVSRDSSYAPHADYYMAYMDYEAGRYAKAKRGFAALADDPSYEALVPYYLIQIEYIEGNYEYVARHAEKLIPHTAMPRSVELAGMAAQSWFRLGEYDRALENVEHYRQMGGTMTRMEHYTAGFALYRAGRWEEAAEHLAKATGADDALSQNSSYHLADIYLHLGDKQRAMQSFSIAAASGVDADIAEDALFNYGKMLFETGAGRFNEAINVLAKYIATYPDGGVRTREARELLIAAYYNSRDYEAAYEAIMQQPDPDNNVRAALQKITYFRALEYYGEGNLNEAQRLLEASSQYRYNPKYTALAAFWQGEILYAQGDYAGAIAKYEEYLRLSPVTEAENRMARYNLGYANFNLKKWPESQKWFDDFLERYTAADSYRADAFNRRGDIRHAERSYWQAIESYDAAAKLDTPEKYYSAYQRAMMLGLVDRPDRKIESLQAIITAGQGDWVEPAAYELGRYYISRNRYSDGAKVLVDFIGRYTSSELYLPALSNLGLAYLNMGDRTRAMNYYKMIVERAPYSREAQDAMAGIRGLYVDAGDVDGYMAYARRSGVPTDVGEAQRDSLTFAAAERFYLAGDARRAIPALENYVKGDARGEYVASALGYLSNLYFGAKRWDDAAATYKRQANLVADPAAKGRAIEGYVASVVASKDPSRIKAMADEVPSMAGATPKSKVDASFAKAAVLRDEGRAAEAVEIYRTLATDTRSAAGAESAFRVIEYLYDTGDYGAAEQAVFAFSQAGTPHNYWLGEAFLTLGDIYVRQGDTFQARATLQSIVDGYSPEDDGIVASAKSRIANL